ncbi:MAG: HNH endonuclease [Treponema sp.]|jgi:hypothetical protein|nr:HNH endonuclease [Treponema sp.]
MTINIKGYEVLIDNEDYELFSKYSWVVDKRPGRVYFKCYGGGGRKNVKHFYLHRLIAGANEPEKGFVNTNNIVDHINHNTLDNRRCNLRICTQAENVRNARGKLGRGLPKGVRKASKNRFSARICANDQDVHLGTFDTVIEAKLAYDNAAKDIYGDYFYEGVMA